VKFGKYSMKQIPMTVLSLLLWFANADEGLAGETCQIVTHAKLSLADFADGPADTDHFYFSDVDSLTRTGKLTIADRYFEIEFEEFRDVYVCTGARNDPCLRQGGDDRFIGEARIDKAIGVVIQMERQTSGGLNPFSRGGVADGDLTLWKIEGCT
tara:strand:+ start:409 stop:873 length:465 start_codon:yes stop_codon:yes gene_type:complete